MYKNLDHLPLKPVHVKTFGSFKLILIKIFESFWGVFYFERLFCLNATLYSSLALSINLILRPTHFKTPIQDIKVAGMKIFEVVAINRETKRYTNSVSSFLFNVFNTITPWTEQNFPKFHQSFYHHVPPWRWMDQSLISNILGMYLSFSMILLSSWTLAPLNPPPESCRRVVLFHVFKF